MSSAGSADDHAADAGGRGLAVVAGAGSGIGRAVAVRLAEGHERVLLLGRRQERLDETARLVRGSTAHCAAETLAADLRDPDEVERVVAAASALAPVDSLVVAVGGYHRSTGEESLRALRDQWQADWSLNVLPVVLLAAGFSPLLRDRRGRVVAVSSIAAVTGIGGPYTSAKAALNGWVRSTARKEAVRGITVNAVAPGYVTGTDFFGRPLQDATHQRLVAEIPTGRPTTPLEVADAIGWLTSDAAGHVTGQVLLLDGGQTLVNSINPA